MKTLSGKTVLIRADSATGIGAGHIARTLVLADALREAGAAVTYACRNYEGSYINLLKDRNHNVRVLPAFTPPKMDKYASWLGAPPMQDVEQSFAGENFDLAIVDHYGADIVWHRGARTHANKLFCIDDEGLNAFDCDLLLNQNILSGAEKLYHDKIPTRCQLLAGPEYALLRSEFFSFRQLAKPRTKLESILIVMGGGDPQRIGEKILKNLTLPVKVTVIVGEQYKNLDALSAFCARKGHTLIQKVENMAALFHEADFCIGAGGNTSWERCCLYLPSALFMISENQRIVAETLDGAGACRSLGAVDSFDFSTINDVLKPFIDAPETLTAMSEKAGSLVDGLGAERTLKILNDIL